MLVGALLTTLFGLCFLGFGLRGGFTCKYCGELSGWRLAHPECVKRIREGEAEIVHLFASCLANVEDPEDFKKRVEQTADAHLISTGELRALEIAGIKSTITTALSDHLVTEQEEHRIGALERTFALGPDDLQPAQDRLVKSIILRDLDSGIIKSRITSEGGLPILLMPEEQLLWVFKDVVLMQLRTKSRYVGGSAGVSFRVVKGVYYHVGQYRGERISTEDLQPVDTGALFVTQQAVYYTGHKRSSTIRMTDVLSVDPYTDAIAVMTRRADSKAHVFQLGDPWFATNLILKTAAFVQERTQIEASHKAVRKKSRNQEPPPLPNG